MFVQKYVQPLWLAVLLATTLTSAAVYRSDSLSTYLLQSIGSESVTTLARTVTTKYGAIRGSLVKLKARRTTTSSSYSPLATLALPDVETYLGVPYATPPTGGLRFMPPVTPTHWRGVRIANRLPPVCPQRLASPPMALVAAGNESEALKVMPRARYEYLRLFLPKLANQSEDCLYLNIYTPVLRPGKCNLISTRSHTFSPFCLCSITFDVKRNFAATTNFRHSLFSAVSVINPLYLSACR